MCKNNILLEIKNLEVGFSTEYGLLQPVKDVSFKVGKGEIVGIVGESGSGKSVTSLSVIQLLPKLGKVLNGQILFEGKDLLALPKEEIRKMRGSEIAMIFQEPLTSLNPLFTVGNQISETIRLHQGVSKQEARFRAIEILKKVGIPRSEKVYDLYPHSLSGGMRQRVMIGMALSSNPKLLIADEPTTALDVTIQAQILKLMKELIQEFETSIIFITHDLGVIAEMADRVIVMYAGQVMEEANVFDLFSEPFHPYTRGLLKSTIKVQTEGEKLDSIEGVVPSLLEIPVGCRFHTRCPYVGRECVAKEPALIKVSEDRYVRCLKNLAETGISEVK